MGDVSLASYPSIATFWLPEVISKFQAEYPGIKIRIMEGITQEIDEWLDVEILLRDNNIIPRIKFTTMENPVLLSMIMNGLGMSIMNELCTTLWKDKLVIMPLDPPENVTFGIASAKDRHMSPAAEKFKEYAVKMLTREEPE